MHNISEASLYSLIEQARSPRETEARLAILNLGDQYALKLTEFSLRAVYRLIFDDFSKLLDANPSLSMSVAPDIDSFRKSPGLKTLHTLAGAITEYCRLRSPQAYFAVNDRIAGIFRHVTANLESILDSKFPGLRGLRTPKAAEIVECASKSRASSDFKGLAAFIKALSANGPGISFPDMVTEFTASCVDAENPDFIRRYLDERGYAYESFAVKRHDVTTERGIKQCAAISLCLKPYGVIESPVMTLPVTPGHSESEHTTLQTPMQRGFFFDDEDTSGHAVFIELADNVTQSSKFLNAVVVATALAFGRENLEFVIEDPENRGVAWELKSMAHPTRITLCNTESQVSESLEALSQFIDARIARTGNYIRSVRKSGSISENLVVVVFVNPGKLSELDAKYYDLIVKKGYRAGVMVVTMDNWTAIQGNQPSDRSLVLRTSRHWSFDKELDAMTVSGIDTSQPGWFENWLKGAGKLSAKWSQTLGRKPEEDEAETVDEFENGFTVLTDAQLSTFIGQANDCEFCFNFDTRSHTHAFIMGKTGSGKSVLLHNIVVGLIHKYSPVDLQLYLLDFKLGGVEFNRYRNIKHLRSLLVDNSDFQIVVEIMRDVESQMKQRGKSLRDAGCNNITDYNRSHADNPMPQIVVVIDECHQIFNSSGPGNTRMQAEVTGILTKIAKEGRNQGVHLIFATQTLAGADIPTDILNNVTDYYLMNCAPSDSERLVSGSSRFTDGLSVGRVYYHHVEQDNVFQGNYVPNEESFRTIEKIVEKSNDYGSNGQLYFNGSQEYELTDENLAIGQATSQTEVLCGKTIDMCRNNLSISLPDDYSENILVCGLNNGDNTSRAAVVTILSLLMSGSSRRIIVLNSGRNNGESIRLLEKLHEDGRLQYVTGDKRPVLDALSKEIISGQVTEPTVVCILSQEQMRELKLDMKLRDETAPSAVETADVVDDIFGGLDFGVKESGSDNSVNTVSEAINLILDKGPAAGVHTVMQVDKIDRFLFDEYPSRRLVFSKFKHLVMLRSDERTPSQLSLADDCHPERLSDEDSRLRAIYYNDNLDTYTMFTPFKVPSYDNFKNHINQ